MIVLKIIAYIFRKLLIAPLKFFNVIFENLSVLQESKQKFIGVCAVIYTVFMSFFVVAIIPFIGKDFFKILQTLLVFIVGYLLVFYLWYMLGNSSFIIGNTRIREYRSKEKVKLQDIELESIDKDKEDLEGIEEVEECIPEDEKEDLAELEKVKMEVERLEKSEKEERDKSREMNKESREVNKESREVNKESEGLQACMGGLDLDIDSDFKEIDSLKELEEEEVEIGDLDISAIADSYEPKKARRRKPSEPIEHYDILN